MKADEYDEFLDNPGDFIIRKFLPRVYANLEGLSHAQPLMSMTGVMMGGFLTFANPRAVEALRTIATMSENILKNMMPMIAFSFKMKAVHKAYPTFVAGFCQTPFDAISNAFRG